jgi:hypothetical protein
LRELAISLQGADAPRSIGGRSRESTSSNETLFEPTKNRPGSRSLRIGEYRNPVEVGSAQRCCAVPLGVDPSRCVWLLGTLFGNQNTLNVKGGVE